MQKLQLKKETLLSLEEQDQVVGGNSTTWPGCDTEPNPTVLCQKSYNMHCASMKKMCPR